MINPLEIFSLDLRSGISWSLLIPAAVALAGLLAYAAFTDIYRQRIIYNSTSLAVIVLCWGLTPLLFANPWSHLAWGLIPVVISLFMYLAGGQGGGDLKLYFGLGPLFGPAGFLFFLLSSLLIIVYALPQGLRNYNRQLPFGQRLGSAPAAPGIALAVPLTAWFLGLSAPLAIAWLGVGVVLFLLWRYWPRPADREPVGPQSWPQEYLS